MSHTLSFDDRQFLIAAAGVGSGAAIVAIEDEARRIRERANAADAKTPSGDSSTAASSGDSSTAASSGNSSKAASSGDYSCSSAAGKDTLAVAAGNGCRVKVGERGAFALPYWTEKDGWRFLCGKVGEDGIEADTWYTIQNGKIVKA